ncbi:hypothetical protein N7471_002181, partial [Penicillium samsonianum]|uniref:uncharacterized protein n=1 Tax=Penicillium samsonianum TaxID=1882272 RepID=UPI002546F52D
ISANLNRILLILTVVSFIPQILRIWTKKNIKGISSFYILFNLISATEQLTIYIYLLFNEYDPKGGTIFLHTPPSAGDWFSLCHCAIVSILSFALFVLVLYYSEYRFCLSAGYTGFLLVSIIPLVIDAIFDFDDEGRRWLSAVYFALHFFLLYQIITILGVLAIWRQAREIRAVPFPNALSLQSLCSQAVVFTLLTAAWIWSLPFPYDKLQGHWNWNTFSIWYGAIGWVIVDNFIFAVGQAALFVMAMRCSSAGNDIRRGRETEPLLG